MAAKSFHHNKGIAHVIYLRPIRRRKDVNRSGGVAVAEVLEFRQLLTGIVHTIDFENVGAALSAESAEDGPAANATQQTGPFGGIYDVGSFDIDDAEFSNVYYAEFSSWSGWAYSNKTDNTTPGFGNQLSAFTGGGANASATYGVSFVDSFSTFGPPSITLDADDARTFDSLQLTNTTYAALSMRDGDSFAKKFGGVSGNDPDWFLLTVTGQDIDKNVVGTVEVYLADYRSTDNSQDYILEEWTNVDLSSLTGSRRLEFGLTSSDNGDFGMNTPAYFAVDNVVLTEPAADLVTTAFDANTDHLLTGQTDVTFTVQNVGNLDAGTFTTHVVWSPNSIVGDDDDVVIAGSSQVFANLPVSAATTQTVSVQIGRDRLYSNAIVNDAAGQAVETASLDVSQLFLVIDTDDVVREGDEFNNAAISNGVSSDDVTHFPWDQNSNGIVEPLEALGAVQTIATASNDYDLNGDGSVTPLEALSFIQRIGYTRADHVIERTELQSASMEPATAFPVLPDQRPSSAVTNVSAETAATASPTIIAVTVESPRTASLFVVSEVDESEIRRIVGQAETSTVDVAYEDNVDWLSAL